ncbi:anthranilate synthase component I [Candidatus Magnetominusculus dajiuhuensis]|uniref:anthranilate synthase component I n=1 Tax=Candidatus Magnetominusculus dajiuhuensis TaxID=3137712 RepID=UPI003B4359BB
MYYPDLEEFKKMAGKGGQDGRKFDLIPVYKEILADAETPVSAFYKIKKKYSFLLESVMGGEKWARYSFLGVSPLSIFKSSGTSIEITDLRTGPGGVRSVRVADDPVEALREELNKFKAATLTSLPRFYGGLVGYMGYENVRFFERLNIGDKPSLGLPDMLFMTMDTVLIFDNLKQVIKVVVNARIMDNPSPEAAYAEATAKIDSIIETLGKSAELPRLDVNYAYPDTQYKSSFNKHDFLGAVEKAKEYIRAGDVFQVVVSQRFETEEEVYPFNIYRALRVINPSPYMFYLDIGDAAIVGSSPEILVRLEGNRVILRPIAGTRPRGLSDEEDLEMERQLKADPKENAEHIMLVDLGRNDVGRVARPGSVEVTDLMCVERYSHVMHLVSNVEGTLAGGLDAFDVLRACFPAGTVTGAPKVRAMEIIDELEPVLRGPYAGAVGYFSFSGAMDMCITIRTLVIKDGTVYVQAGAGIVADSIPEGEYNETVNKAKGMMRAVQMAKTQFSLNPKKDKE